jgi:Tol biopolymer transport system component
MKYEKLSFCLALLASLALAGVFSTAIPSTQEARSADAMLGAALHLEEVEGNLEGAIDTYKRFLAQYRDNESLAAKAQLHIGICYEKLGQREARTAYQTVIDRYPQQIEAVKIAKQRISRLADTLEAATDKPKFRKITIPFKLSWWSPTPIGPAVDFGARMSPDGQTLVFGSEGSIWVVPVPGKASPDIAGEPRRLTEAMYALGAGISWSGDGSLIAFNAARGEDSQDIFIIPSQGGEPKKLTSREPSFGLATNEQALSLSPNGEVLAFQTKWDGEGIIGWSRILTLARGAASPKNLIDTKAAKPAFSPDGRMIAYVNYSPMEIRVIPASGGKSIRVVDTSNREVSTPIWSPDGRMLAFLSGNEIWIVPVSENGLATTAPTIFRLPRWNGMPLAGWTSDNKIGFIWGGEQVDTAVYSVPVAGGKALQVTPFGFFFFPRWSPDGKRIWFLNGNTSHTLGSVPSGGGAVSNLVAGTNPVVQEVPPGGGNVISPDGQTVVFAGMAGKGVNLWVMPLGGGQPTELTTPLPDQQERFPCWSPDGKSVLFIRLRYTPKSPLGTADIYRIPSKGGEAKPVTSASDVVAYSSIACSPDGKWVAYFSHDSALSEGKAPPGGSSESANCIKIKPIDGGPSQVVTGVHHRSGHEELCWSPDGKMIAYNADMGIWVVSASGGTPKQVETGLDESLIRNHLSWSPDGRTLAFTGYRLANPELWLMEDFLPLVKR